ncbi:MAG: desulfoferrodoxin family protein [bacterium]
MKGIVCSRCGFIALEGSAPEQCPICGAPKNAFKEKNNAIIKPSQVTDKQESNKKHIPYFMVKKECTLIPGGCIDVHVKVGEITHPMLPEHYIMYLDSYLDNKYLSRTYFNPDKLIADLNSYLDNKYLSRIYFNPDKLNPATVLHVKAKGGKFTAIEKCNIHGTWINEIEL